MIDKVPKQDDVFSDYYGAEIDGLPFNDRVIVRNSDMAISKIEIQCDAVINSIQVCNIDCICTQLRTDQMLTISRTLIIQTRRRLRLEPCATEEGLDAKKSSLCSSPKSTLSASRAGMTMSGSPSCALPQIEASGMCATCNVLT